MKMNCLSSSQERKVESWFSEENNDFEATKVAFVSKLASYTIAAFGGFCLKNFETTLNSWHQQVKNQKN